MTTHLSSESARTTWRVPPPTVSPSIVTLNRVLFFDALRHTAVTNVYRASHDLFLAQRFTRHVSPLTTVCYTHPSDEELREGVRGLRC